LFSEGKNMQRPTKEQIRDLPMYVGLDLLDIRIIENEQDAAEALKALDNETCLGFDTESKPIFRKGQVNPGPSLIQLATESKGYLFPTRFPAAVNAVRVLLSNSNIKKFGFGLKGDNKELRNKLDIEINNTEDLSVTLKNLVDEKNSIGARAAVAMVLNTRLGKGAQKSNWGTYPLKNNQVLYAANDAHCAICIVAELKAKGLIVKSD
jgi:ribonuclease D